MINLKNFLVLLLVLISTPVLAFMPAAGMWGIDSENNGLPGRGFQIEAENEIIVFTYFGYREDGSSTFNYASGPIVNNIFTAPLLVLHGGTPLGGNHQNAHVIGSAGTVTINFTSGNHGFISLPGEPSRAISKRPFGYADGPDGLLGKWLFTMVAGQTPSSEISNLSIKTGQTTSTGNGVVTNTERNFGCELQISGVLAGVVLCTNNQGSKIYSFKPSGDKGDGIAALVLPSGDLGPEQVGYGFRIATKSGTNTGLNNGTLDSLSLHSLLAPSNVERTKEQVSNEKSITLEDSAISQAIKTWILEAKLIMLGIH